MQIITVALKDVMLFEPNFNVQVARRATVGTRLTIARATDAHATVDTGWNLDLESFLPLDLALAVAGTAGLGNDLASPAAGGAGLLNAEKALAHLHRTTATAGTT